MSETIIRVSSKSFAESTPRHNLQHQTKENSNNDADSECENQMEVMPSLNKIASTPFSRIRSLGRSQDSYYMSRNRDSPTSVAGLLFSFRDKQEPISVADTLIVSNSDDDCKESTRVACEHICEIETIDICNDEDYLGQVCLSKNKVDKMLLSNVNKFSALSSKDGVLKFDVVDNDDDDARTRNNPYNMLDEEEFETLRITQQTAAKSEKEIKCNTAKSLVPIFISTGVKGKKEERNEKQDEGTDLEIVCKVPPYQPDNCGYLERKQNLEIADEKDRKKKWNGFRFKAPKLPEKKSVGLFN